MTNFTIYNETNAPEGSRDTLAAVKGSMGFIPNLLGTMAEAPSALKAYVQLLDLVADTSLTAQEQRLMTLAISAENGCDYCVAAEAMLADKVANVPMEHIEAVREDRTLSDPKLNAFVQFARDVVASRGYPSDNLTAAFFAAGYTQANILEVVVGATIKTLSNYTNHIARTPIDDAFADYAPKTAEAVKTA
jgi:uncharacterized peroxidase-related enzyme